MENEFNKTEFFSEKKMTRRSFFKKSINSSILIVSSLILGPFLPPHRKANASLPRSTVKALIEFIKKIYKKFLSGETIDESITVIGDNNKIIVINCNGCGHCLHEMPSPENPIDSDAEILLYSCPFAE